MKLDIDDANWAALEERFRKRSEEQVSALRLSRNLHSLLRDSPRDRQFAALVYELARVMAESSPLVKADEKALMYRIGSVIRSTTWHIREKTGAVNGAIALWDLQWWADGRPKREIPDGE